LIERLLLALIVTLMAHSKLVVHCTAGAPHERDSAWLVVAKSIAPMGTPVDRPGVVERIAWTAIGASGRTPARFA